MPIPFILGGIAAAAAVTGIAKGVSGVQKMNDAKESIENAKAQDEKNRARYQNTQEHMQSVLNAFGKLELETLKSLQQYYDLTGRIKHLPTANLLSLQNDTGVGYKPEDIKNASIGAGEILAKIGTSTAAAGIFTTIAAGGAASAAVTACGTLGVAASTGTAIASLSGAAATNATLAALGGGAIAAGGGGVALGSLVLGASTLGIGLLVGGFMADSYGNSLSDKAEEAWKQVREHEEKIDRECAYMEHLSSSTDKLRNAFCSTAEQYSHEIQKLDELITRNKKDEWKTFQENEKMIVENLDILVRFLHHMTAIQLCRKKSDDVLPQVNDEEIYKAVYIANKLKGSQDPG